MLTREERFLGLRARLYVQLLRKYGAGRAAQMAAKRAKVLGKLAKKLARLGDAGGSAWLHCRETAFRDISRRHVGSPIGRTTSRPPMRRQSAGEMQRLLSGPSTDSPIVCRDITPEKAPE